MTTDFATNFEQSSVWRLHERFCNYSYSLKGNSLGTIKDFKCSFRNFLSFNKTIREDITQITKHSIEDWIFHNKMERKWAPKTIRNYLQWMSLFLKWCVDEELIEKNPADKISKPRLPKRIPKHLSLEETETLLDWVRNYPYKYKFYKYRTIAIFYLFLYTGLRREELRNLNVENVNFTSNTITVRGGKGDKDRIIPINNKLILILNDYLKERTRLNPTSTKFLQKWLYIAFN